MRYAILGLLSLALLPAVVNAGDRHRGGGSSSRSGFSIGFGYSERSGGGWGDRSSSRFDASFRVGSDRYDRHDYGRRDFYRHDRYDYGRGNRYYYPAPVIVTPPPVYCPPAPVYRPPVVIYRPAPVYCPPPPVYYHPQRQFGFRR